MSVYILPLAKMYHESNKFEQFQTKIWNLLCGPSSQASTIVESQNAQKSVSEQFNILQTRATSRVNSGTGQLLSFEPRGEICNLPTLRIQLRRGI